MERTSGAPRVGGAHTAQMFVEFAPWRICFEITLGQKETSLNALQPIFVHEKCEGSLERPIPPSEPARLTMPIEQRTLYRSHTIVIHACDFEVASCYLKMAREANAYIKFKEVHSASRLHRHFPTRDRPKCTFDNLEPNQGFWA